MLPRRRVPARHGPAAEHGDQIGLSITVQGMATGAHAASNPNSDDPRKVQAGRGLRHREPMVQLGDGCCRNGHGDLVSPGVMALSSARVGDHHTDNSTQLPQSVPRVSCQYENLNRQPLPGDFINCFPN